jgi:hypothetical protein
VKVEVAVFAPVFRVAVLVLTDPFQATDIDTSNTLLDTSLDDVFGETVEEVGAAFRPLRMEMCGSFTTLSSQLAISFGK